VSVFEATVDHIARDHDTNPTRVNYATRRRALACWHMPKADWAELCADIPQIRPDDGQNGRSRSGISARVGPPPSPNTSTVPS
jgi:hypothetical protein